MLMRNSAHVLITTLLIGFLPTIALGQALFGSPCPGFPTSSLESTIYVGYLSTHKGAGLSFDTTGGDLFTIRDFRQDYTVEGIWGQLDVPVRSSGPLGLAFGLGYLFPFRQKSLEAYTLTTGPGRRVWDADIQLWNVEAALTLNLSCSVMAVAGFRYESLLTNFSDPEEQVAVGGSSEDEADFAFSGYIPFLGVIAERIDVYGARGKAGMVGFPALPGAFEYRETVSESGLPGPGNTARMLSNNEFHSGYFFEAFGELAVRVYGTQMGAFAKYSMAHGKTTADVNAQVGSIVGPALRSFHNRFDVNFDRRYWIIGGNVALNF
jgi:hypothetical protein